MHAEQITIEYMRTKFGVDSSSRFHLQRGQTDRQTNEQTRLNALPTPAAIQLACVIID